MEVNDILSRVEKVWPTRTEAFGELSELGVQTMMLTAAQYRLQESVYTLREFAQQNVTQTALEQKRLFFSLTLASLRFAHLIPGSAVILETQLREWHVPCRGEGAAKQADPGLMRIEPYVTNAVLMLGSTIPALLRGEKSAEASALKGLDMLFRSVIALLNWGRFSRTAFEHLLLIQAEYIFESYKDVA